MVSETVDVALIGAGIMSATLGTLLQQVEPGWSIAVFEARDGVAQESSDAWNNSGTGHSGFCELDYATARSDGSLDISKPIAVNEMFQVTRQFWTSLIASGRLPAAERFVHPTPHMAFVTGESHVAFVRAWHDTLTREPLFAGMGFSDDIRQIANWSRALTDGRGRAEPIAATFEASGTEVDYGTLARLLMDSMVARGAQLNLGHRVTKLAREGDRWRLTHGSDAGTGTIRARFAFIGAGGGSLALLRSAGVREVAGHAGFPVSGKFLMTHDPQVVALHRVKAYGKADTGMPSIGATHLDHRTLDGREAVMFGPYAGFTPKFLKYGSRWDLPRSVRRDNLGPLLAVARDNPGLLRYLVGELTAPRDKQLRALKRLMPEARDADWRLVTAGQRLQIIRTGPAGRGQLHFGTELMTPPEGNLAALLGASPGASTAVPIMIDVLNRCFPGNADRWANPLRELVPSLGRELNTAHPWASAIRQRTAAALGLGGA